MTLFGPPVTQIFISLLNVIIIKAVKWKSCHEQVLWQLHLSVVWFLPLLYHLLPSWPDRSWKRYSNLNGSFTCLNRGYWYWSCNTDKQVPNKSIYEWIFENRHQPKLIKEANWPCFILIKVFKNKLLISSTKTW